MSVLVKTGRSNFLNRILSAGDLKLGLYTNALAPDADTEIGDVTEANYSGYARIEPTPAAVIIDGAGLAKSVFDPETFQHNGGGVGNGIRGWFLMDDDTGELLVADALPAARSMALAGDSLTIEATMYLSELP